MHKGGRLIQKKSSFFKNYFINLNFTILLIGSFVSFIGTRMYEVALTWWIYQKTGSSLNVGWFMIAAFLPGIIASPYSGYILDRVSRRNVMIWMDLIRGILMIALMVSVSLGKLDIPFLVIITIFVSICDSFFSPAVNSIVPDIMDKEIVVRANSLYQLFNNLSKIIGPALGAAFLGTIGVSGIILINAFSFIISGFFEILIKVEEKHLKLRKKSQGFFSAFKEFGTFFKKDVFVFSIIILIGVLNLFTGALHVLLPAHVERLNMGSVHYGTIMSARSTGAILTTVMASIFGRVEATTLLLAGSLFLYGFSVLLFAGTPLFVLMIVCYFAVGVAQTLFNVSVLSSLQKFVPPELRGRVFAIANALSISLIPLSYGLFGILGNYLKTNIIFTITAVALIAGGVSMLLVRPGKNKQ